MAANSRFVLACHLLTLLGLFAPQRLTSAQIGRSLGADAAAVRRHMQLLRPSGWIDQQPGASGGYTLTTQPQEISLAAVRAAVDPEDLFATHRSPPFAGCAVGAGIVGAMSPSLDAANDAVAEALGQRSIRDLMDDILASDHPNVGRFNLRERVDALKGSAP